MMIIEAVTIIRELSDYDIENPTPVILQAVQELESYIKARIKDNEFKSDNPNVIKYDFA